MTWLQRRDPLSDDCQESVRIRVGPAYSPTVMPTVGSYGWFTYGLCTSLSSPLCGCSLSLIRLPQVTDRCLKLVIKNDGTELNFTQVSRPSPPSSRTIPDPPGRGQEEDAHGLTMQPSAAAV